MFPWWGSLCSPPPYGGTLRTDSIVAAMAVEIIPFVRVGDVAFGSDPAAVIGIMGERYTQQVNRIGLTEIDYGTAVYRFDDDAVLVEITVGAPVLELDGQDIAFEALADFLRANDPNAFECAGFMISPRYGIAFDPWHASWVTAFPENMIDSWRNVGTP